MGARAEWVARARGPNRDSLFITWAGRRLIHSIRRPYDDGYMVLIFMSHGGRHKLRGGDSFYSDAGSV